MPPSTASARHALFEVPAQVWLLAGAGGVAWWQAPVSPSIARARRALADVPVHVWLLAAAAGAAWWLWAPSYRYARSTASFDDLLGEMGIDPAMARAVMQVEAGGRPRVDGRVVIRFEPRVFRRESGGRVVLLPGMSDVKDGRGRFSDRRRSLEEKQAEEHAALGRAIDLSREAAYRSISMGIAQIMGFNHRRLGYGSAEEMFDAFQADDEAQRIGFLKFLASDRHLVRALRSGDFGTFARIYNGDRSGQYAARMAEAYEAIV